MTELTRLLEAPPLGRGARPFTIAAVLAALPLLALSAASPGGASWRWLELPFRVPLLALGLVLVARRLRPAPALLTVALGTPLLHAAIAIAAEWRALASLGSTTGIEDELPLLFKLTLGAVGPWGCAAAYATLALLAAERRRGPADALDRNVVSAASWLVVVGVAVAALAFFNPTWATLDNLKGHGIYRSSVPWPDTKLIAVALAALTVAGGLLAAVLAWSRRRRRRRFVVKVASGKIAGWTIIAGTDPALPVLLEGGRKGRVDALLARVTPPAGEGPYREAQPTTPVAAIRAPRGTR